MVDIKISELSNVASGQLTDLFEISRNIGGGLFESYSLRYHELIHSILGQQVITVGATGAITTTIKDAVDLAISKSPSVTNPITIIVQPGTYSEDPIVIPSYVSITGLDGSKVTLIDALDPNNIMFTMSINSSLKGMRLTGANGVNGVAVKSTTGSADSILTDIAIRNCTKAVYSSGVASAIRCYQCTLLTSSGTSEYGVLADDGGVILLVSSIVRIAGTGIINYGICAKGVNSKITASTCQLTGVQNALCVDDGGTIDSNSLFIKNSTYALRIENNGNDSIINCFATDITNAFIYDIFIESITGEINYSGKVDVTKRSIVSGGSFNCVGLTNNPQGTYLTGEVSVEENLDVGFPGTTTLGLDVGLDVGEGGSYDQDEQGNPIVEYWQYDASSPSGSRFTRYANNAGTQLTDNGDAIIVGSKFPFSTARIDINVIANLGGNSIVVEHWNGATWTEDQISVYKKTDMIHRGNVLFQNVETQYVEVGTKINDDWVNDQNFLDEVPDWDVGFNMYPIRFRNNGGSLVTGMEFDSGKVRGDDFDITEAKVTVNWGRYRGTETIVVPSYEMNPDTVKVPDPATITYSPHIKNTALSKCSDTKIAAMSYLQIIPDWADTSSGINLSVLMYSSDATAGNVNIIVRYLPLSPGLVLDGSATDYSTSLIVPAPGVAESIFATSNLFDISVFNPRQGFIISLERDATGANPLDTYVGDIVIIGVTMQWTRKIVG